MANKYSEALLSAIDIIAKQRVGEANYDKTIVAKVLGKNENGSYLLKYEDAFIEAFSKEKLAAGTMVYVLIPQGDMSQEKQVVGKVSFYEKEEQVLLWENTKGIILKNNSIIGYVDQNNQYIYLD